MKNIFSNIFFACKGLSNGGIGAATGTVLQEIRLRAGFKTGDFVREKLGGLPTVERLVSLTSIRPASHHPRSLKSPGVFQHKGVWEIAHTLPYSKQFWVICEVRSLAGQEKNWLP